MNILIAPNSMKGSLSAFQFADEVERAFNDVAPSVFKIRKMPVADGGDETVHVLMNALGLDEQEVLVTDPLGRPILAKYGYAGGIAVIEMANASGLKLLSLDELNPMKTSSFGTGEVILDAIAKGTKKIFVGIGGSATVDGRMGMSEALGIQFLDNTNNLLKGNGANLGEIARIEIKSKLVGSDVEIVVVSDVDNLLLGEAGAARIFGPQKGATPLMVEQLEKNLTHYAEIIKSVTDKDLPLSKEVEQQGVFR